MNLIIMEKYGARLYRMDTRALADEDYFRSNYAGLSPMRQNKIDSYRLKRDQRLSLGAGMLLDRGLSQYGMREADTAIAYGANGKPYLPGRPRIHFNLSHSEEMVLAVFAEVETGCDVERVRQADLTLAKRFFCPGEYEYIAGQEEGERQNEAFYRLWTLKESFVKTVGLGLSLPLDAFEVQISREGAVTVCQQVDGAAYQFSEYRFGQYCAAACFREPTN